MKKLIYILTLFFVFAAASAMQVAGQNVKISADPFKVEAVSETGFDYPYYLYVPPELRDIAAQKERQTILVLPGNTGAVDDSFAVHQADVKKRMEINREAASVLRVMVLTPVFPRPKIDWQVYTHALDRDSLTTDKKELHRFDLQLIAMIDDARARMKKQYGLRFDRKVLLNGFSATGMFANRFTFLHPTRVKAAAIGSPGGWAIAPTTEFKGKTLRYPIGIGDFETVTGKKLDLKSLRKVPLFVFMGDKDDNDSVVFGDSYEDADKDLIFELFGKTPVERWETSKMLYLENKLNAEFKLYTDIAHTVSPEMRIETRAFLAKYK